MTDDELITKSVPPRRWAVEGLIVRGSTTLLIAAEKEGKSRIAFQAGRAIVTGEPFFGLPVVAGNVLHLGLENDETGMQELLAEALTAEAAGKPEPSEAEKKAITENDSRYHMFLEDMDYPNLEEGGLQEIAGFLEDTPDVRMVTIDLLECFDPVRGGYHTAGVTIRRLNRFARKYDIALVAVMHTHDTVKLDRLTQRLQGGRGAPAAAGTTIALSHPNQEPTAAMKSIGRFAPGITIKLKWDNGRFTLDTDEAPEVVIPEAELTRKREQVVGVVAEHAWGKDPSDGSQEPIPVGLSAYAAAYILRRETSDDSWSHANVRQMMYQMRTAKPKPLLIRKDKRYYTPEQAALLKIQDDGNQQTAFDETPSLAA